MGLIVTSLAEIADAGDVGRSLYIYLLDYGWPDGPYEKMFRENWAKLSERASQTGALVIKSQNGRHFANEVLNWHSIGGHDADELLPAILLTHTAPSYFSHRETAESHSMFSDPLTGDPDTSLGDFAVLPLKRMCTTPEQFLDWIETIFNDLEKGLQLRGFRAAKFDVVKPSNIGMIEWAKTQVGQALILQPNFGGLGIDLKKLFAKEAK